MADVNLISIAVGAIATTIAGVVVARAAKNSDARATAEAALWNNQPTIMAEQNRQITGLREEVDRIWHELQETYARERKCRDDLAECNRRIIALEAKLGGPK